MGAKTWMLVYSTGNAGEALRRKPPLDRDRSAALAAQLFPAARLTPAKEVDLSRTSPEEDNVHIRCYGDVTVVATLELALDNPSLLDPAFLRPDLGDTICLHAMHSVVDWFAFAIWRDGKLPRSLSLSPDSRIIEDISARRPFEKPYWAGERRLRRTPLADQLFGPRDEYPLPFHPLEMGSDAMVDLFGYRLEGRVDPSLLRPEGFPLLTFARV